MSLRNSLLFSISHTKGFENVKGLLAADILLYFVAALVFAALWA